MNQWQDKTKKLCPKLWIQPNQITVLQDYHGGEVAENQEVQFPWSELLWRDEKTAQKAPCALCSDSD